MIINSFYNSIILFLLIITVGYGQTKDIGIYAFRHSLIDHRPPAIPTPSNETTIFHWMNDIAVHHGQEFSAGGQYGFLTNHDDLPPFSQWGYDEVPPVWDSETESFADSKINTVMLTAANFIQYVSPEFMHPLDEMTSATNSTLKIFDWVKDQNEQINLYIYINWPEMNLEQEYPPNLPSEEEWNLYNEYTQNDFLRWWTTMHDQVIMARPYFNIKAIPVGPILSKLLNTIIADVPFSEIYEDSAPHGRPSLYFLAGLISYMAIFEEIPDDTYQPDVQVHHIITDNLTEIKALIWGELLEFNFFNGTSRVFLNNSSSVLSGINKGNSITIFPNPTSDKIYIESSLNDFNIIIFNSLGQITYSKFRNHNQTELDIAGLTNGVYILAIYDENEQVYHTQIFCKE